MSTFDTIRRLFDRDHRQPWEDAFSSLEVFEDNRIRVIATTPEKVLESPGHPLLPDATAQVLFSDQNDTPRITLDFYEAGEEVVVGVSFFVGEQAVSGGFQKIESIESWIADQASKTASYLSIGIEKATAEFGDLRTKT